MVGNRYISTTEVCVDDPAHGKRTFEVGYWFSGFRDQGARDYDLEIEYIYSPGQKFDISNHLTEYMFDRIYERVYEQELEDAWE